MSNDLNISSGYGAQLEHSLKSSDIKMTEDRLDAFKLALAAEELDANAGWKNSENKKVQANGYTVIFTKYPKNPYRVYKKTASGIITDVGLEGNQLFRSHETGEMEEAELGVICCHVVSVGPECKYVKEGDDIYLRNVGLAPVPFAGRGYWAVSEQNVICRVVPEDFQYERDTEQQWLDINELPTCLGNDIPERIENWIEYKKKGVCLTETHN